MIEGDARDEGALIRALDGCDAVVSSLGTGVGFREVSLLTVATRALVTAMTRSGVRVWSALAPWGSPPQRAAGRRRDKPQPCRQDVALKRNPPPKSLWAILRPSATA
jgi:hypothetical protein